MITLNQWRIYCLGIQEKEKGGENGALSYRKEGVCVREGCGSLEYYIISLRPV